MTDRDIIELPPTNRTDLLAWCIGMPEEAADTIERLTAREQVLVKALEKARHAIASLPPSALGMAQDEDKQIEWPIRDELLAGIDAAPLADRGKR